MAGDKVPNGSTPFALCWGTEEMGELIESEAKLEIV